MKQIENRIKEIMKVKKMSMGDLSKLTGIPKTTVSRYLADVSNIPADRLTLIAKALNTTPEYIMGWEKVEPEVQNEKLNELVYKAKDLNDEELNSVLIHVNGIIQSKKTN